MKASLNSSLAIALLVFPSFALSGCGGESNSENSSEQYQYHFTENLNGRECDAGEINASSLAEHCRQLADSTLNHGCASEQRRDAFRDECEKAGYAWPNRTVTHADPTATPYPPATPYPSATPLPTVAPDSTPQIVRDFAAHGINVSISSVGSTSPLPGHPSFNRSLQNFYLVMERNQNLFYQHRTAIHTLTLTVYTHDHSQTSNLSIDVKTSDSELQQYFSIFDRKRNLEQNSGFAFDFGIEVVSHRTLQFETAVRFFETANLYPLQGVVKSIKLDTIDYFSPESRELSLNQNKYQISLATFVQANAPLLSFLQNCLRANIEVDFGVNFNFFTQTALLTKLGEDLNRVNGLLIGLAESGNLKKLNLFPTLGNPRYSSFLKVLTLNAQSGASFDSVLTALNLDFLAVAGTGINLELPDELTSDFLNFSAQLQSVRSLLVPRASKIHSIFMTTLGTSRFDSVSLIISTDDSAANLAQLIRGI